MNSKLTENNKYINKCWVCDSDIIFTVLKISSYMFTAEINKPCKHYQGSGRYNYKGGLYSNSKPLHSKILLK